MFSIKKIRNSLMPRKSAIDSSKPNLSAPSGQKRAPEGEITKRKKGPGGIFGSKPYLNRFAFRQRLKRVSGNVPGRGVYTTKERLALEDKLFPKDKFGEYITPYEVSRQIKALKHKIYRHGDALEKIELRKQLDFLKSLRGEDQENKN